uniref:D-isomer specific 2-hydroxyacid dehydrogenase NAD-binding domain-containing protein n=1 Tax=Hippocampus comes TaxID=109280 RepID=A0A3Q2XTH3_HIPCM
MVNNEFVGAFRKPFWLLNTARGRCVITKDLVKGLKSGKILGAGLDPKPFKYLRKANNVIMTPHVAGWSIESKEKLAQREKNHSGLFGIDRSP